MWEPRLWYQPVTPRSGGYGDVTATYIRRSEIPSRIYAKHQYRQVKEYGSTWQYIFQHKDYKVITERDILVHVHYITARYKSEITICTTKSAHGLRRRASSLLEDPGTERLGQISLLREIGLIFSGGLRFNPRFRTWTCKFRGVRNSLTNMKVKAKCLEEISICMCWRDQTVLSIKNCVECTCTVSMKWRHKMKVIRLE